MDTFNLRTFLTENKLTTNSRVLSEAKFPSFKTTDDGKVVDAATNFVYYDEGDTPEFEKLMDRAMKEPQVAAAFGKWMKSNNLGRKDLGDINVIKQTYSKFKQDVDRGSDEEIKNRVDAISYFAGDDDNDWNSAVKDLADRAVPKGPPAAPSISKLQKPQAPAAPKAPQAPKKGPTAPPLPPKPGQ
tara:strand:- start:558 stop:1115 length:558 start_codon:yes stop_codon:yes gene_type:complete